MNNVISSHIEHQELQHLITISSGFVDAYIIQCYQSIPIILPQNIILSSIDCSSDAVQINWHEEQLPVYAMHNPELNQVVALVVEADAPSERFALLCDEMPKAVRIRISELIDDHDQEGQVYTYQTVRFMNQLFRIPDLDAIQRDLKIRE